MERITERLVKRTVNSGNFMGTTLSSNMPPIKPTSIMASIWKARLEYLA